MGESPGTPVVVEGLSRYDRHRLQAGLRRLAETGASTLEVARAAVWLYGEDGERLHRIHLYHRSSGEHVAGGELRREHFPAYFAALDEGEVLAAEDVHGDPRTEELSEPYAAPLGINSWIDAPIAGAGILRFEHLGPARSWSARERSVAHAVATAVGALLGYFDARRDASGEAKPPGTESAEGPASAAREEAAPHGREEPEQGDGRRPAPARPRRDGAPATTGASASADDLLADAVADDRVALRWQPIQRASDGSRVGVEALLRLRRPEEGALVTAGEFVPRAEETGAVVSLDRWVLDRAAARAAAWRRAGAVDWIALNVSPLSLLDDGYRAALEERSRDGALDPATVLLQVALDLDRHPTVQVGRALFSLWESGFGICLDLAAADELLEIALTALPADVLEVSPDRAERWEADGPPAAIREARRSRGLRLLAKKLETPDQERRARALECDLVAGRLLGPPAAADELAEVTAAARTRSADRPDRDGS